jgi:hypothetical protein
LLFHERRQRGFSSLCRGDEQFDDTGNAPFQPIQWLTAGYESTEKDLSEGKGIHQGYPKGYDVNGDKR